jgi:hypothetical protein
MFLLVLGCSKFGVAGVSGSAIVMIFLIRYFIDNTIPLSHLLHILTFKYYYLAFSIIKIPNSLLGNCRRGEGHNIIMFSKVNEQLLRLDNNSLAPSSDNTTGNENQRLERQKSATPIARPSRYYVTEIVR